MEGNKSSTHIGNTMPAVPSELSRWTRHIFSSQCAAAARWPLGGGRHQSLQSGLIHVTSQGPCWSNPSMAPAVLLRKPTSVFSALPLTNSAAQRNAAETTTVYGSGRVLRELKRCNLRTTGGVINICVDWTDDAHLHVNMLVCSEMLGGGG